MPMPPHKHIVESNALGEAGAVQRTITIVQGAINPDPFTNINQVKAGSIVQAIQCQIDFLPSAVPAADDIINFFIWFNINGAQTQPTMLLLSQNHLKNQIFFCEGGIISPAQGHRLVYRFLLRIPPQYQQINDGDTIEFVYKRGLSPALDTAWRFIYKEYFP